MLNKKIKKFKLRKEYNLVKLFSIVLLANYNECLGTYGSCNKDFDICKEDYKICD